MLGLESGNLRGPGGTGRVVSAHAAHFVFGGVAFELLADRACELPFGDTLPRFLLPAALGDGLAQVVVALSWDRELGAPRERLHFVDREAAECTELSSRHLRARLRPVGPGRYLLDARVAPSVDGLTTLLLAASSSVLQREGGLNLHATAVELDGRALLLIGPSGAGKSTACDLIEDASCIAHDRVTLSPARDGGFHVWALPGGKAPLRTPLSARVELPLAGLLRVRRGKPTPCLEPLSGASALFAAHEAVETTVSAADIHERRLGVLQALCDAAPVGALYTVLGQPLGALVRGFVHGSRVRHAEGRPRVASAGTHATVSESDGGGQ